jgi:hypothetical protein
LPKLKIGVDFTVNPCYKKNMTKRYAYFFTRQDIFKEYQLVQTAHVAYKLGSALGKDADADNTYFTCVGVRNLEALLAVEKILFEFGIKYEHFVEPDLNGGEMTAIAVHPIDEDKRDILLAFNLLKF